MADTADATDPGSPGPPAPLEIELQLVHEAVRMVACGAALRVVLAGLQCANELLGAAGDAALEPGVRLMPLWRPDDAGIDIAVEGVKGSSSRPGPSLATGADGPVR